MSNHFCSGCRRVKVAVLLPSLLNSEPEVIKKRRSDSEKMASLQSAVPTYSKTLIRRRTPRVLIVGAGVIGMTCALQLLEQGYRVTVVAKEFASLVSGKLITSEVAGALWEWPPAVCGGHTDKESLDRAKVWCTDSYTKFVEMAMRPDETGVFVKQSVFYFKDKVEDTPDQMEKMKELCCLPGFVHDHRLIEQTEVNPDTGVMDAYQHMAPMVDTVVFMQWLYTQCKAKGCRFVYDYIQGLLSDQAEDLKNKYKAQVIINCSGLNAKELAGDNDVYPSRGAILKVRNDGSLMPKLNHSMSVSITDKIFDSEQADQDFIYILPRNDDKLWLGGLVQPNQWDQNINLQYPPVRRMFEKLKEFFPPLRNYGDDDVEEVLVGLRPGRKGGNIRLEWDPVSPSVLHNYGHGGAGVTLSWGCAKEVGAMVDHALKRHKLIYMSRL